MEIHLIRHTSVKDVEGICYGQSDVSLFDNYQLAFNAIEIQNYDAIYSSPLSRCTILAQHFSPTFYTDQRLLEMNFGAWELKKWDDICAHEFKIWEENYITQGPPQGESVNEMLDRVLHFFKEINQLHLGKKVLIVTHSGVIKLILNHLQKNPVSNMFSIKIGYGEQVIVKDFSSLLE